MSVFNLFKKKTANPEVLFNKMYPKGNGKDIIYESFKNISDKMTSKMAEKDALALYVLCSMKFELLKKNKKTVNEAIKLIQREKPNLFTEIEAKEMATQIYADAMSRFLNTRVNLI